MTAEKRLHALQEYKILDSLPEQSFDDLTLLASSICAAPVALISLIDRDRQWFKSKVGVDITETPLEISFCKHAIENEHVLIIPDATLDGRFADNPLVTTSPHIRFYAGAPLLTPCGSAIGTICVVDVKPRALDDIQKTALESLARQVVAQLELRKNFFKLSQAHGELELLNRAIEAATSGVVISDGAHEPPRIISVNSAFSQITGYTSADVHGSQVSMLYGPETDMAQTQKLAESLRAGIPQRTVLKNYRKDGSSFWGELSAAPVLNEKKEVAHYVGILTDVTARIEAQEKIREQQKTLSYYSKMSALGEMASGLAHEINNPIAIMSTKVQKLRRALESSPAAIHETLEKLENTIDRIASIVKGLRLVARDGTQDKLVPTSMKAVINDTLFFCEEKLRRSGVELRMSTLSNDLIVECRATQVAQVLINLLNNACDAVASVESKWIAIDLNSSAHGLTLRITDSGAGIDAAARKRMFESFFTTKELGKGTGLGLSISKEIIEDHGGTIRLDDSCSQTSFVITLPKVHETKKAQAA